MSLHQIVVRIEDTEAHIWRVDSGLHLQSIIVMASAQAQLYFIDGRPRRLGQGSGYGEKD